MKNNGFDERHTSQLQYSFAIFYGATLDKVAYLDSTDSHRNSIGPICGKHFTLVFAKKTLKNLLVFITRCTVVLHFSS